MAGRFDPEKYVGVSERLEKFRADHPEWGLLAEVIKDDGTAIAIKATITNMDGRIVATGHAEEIRGEGMVNKTSPMENCETSAWGRALAALGYEVSRGIASREEMQKVNRPAPEPTTDLSLKINTELTQAEKDMLKEQWTGDGYTFKASSVPASKVEEVKTLIDSFVGLEAQMRLDEDIEADIQGGNQ